MKGLILCGTFVFFSALVWVVQATSCKHHDLTLCFAEISCNNDTKEIGCEHDVCTCVDIPPTPPPAQHCLSVADCVLSCKPDESEHCLDNLCMCRKDH